MNYLGRIKEQHHDLYQVQMEENQTITAKVSGKLRYQIKNQEEYPVVGDYVMLDRNSGDQGDGIIVEIQPRKTSMQRVEAGKTGRIQVIAANVDIVFICMSLNENFNLRRLERYLAAVYGCQIRPVLLLTKVDLCPDVENYLNQVKNQNPDLEILLTSSLNTDTLRAVRQMIEKDMTVSFIGSSGVGKSTLINGLMGEEYMKTGEIREDDDRGHHTTTHRELMELPGGGTVIDTPGMRELSLDQSDVKDVFEEIEEIGTGCRFRNCTHTNEPGCMVQEAIKNGEIDPKRFRSYLKLKKEETRRKR